MSSKRSGGGAVRHRRPLTKTMLLPMEQATVREQSLTYHLALATCRDGHGNGYLFRFLQQSGYGNEPVEQYKTAECAVEEALARAHESNEWILTEDAVPAFERLLALHDSQLAVSPRQR